MDFVTICFIEDLPQLKVQARSMDLYLSDFPVDSISVIVNGWAKRCLPYLDKQVLPYYGSIADKVQFISSSDLISPSPHPSGYHTQQLLKLLSSRIVSTPQYCILDAKNFFVKPLEIADVFFDGKLRTYYQKEDVGVWEPFRQNTFSYFGLDPSLYQPITQHTAWFAYKDLVEDIVKPPSFIQDFFDKEMVEFYAIQASIIKQMGSIEAVYHVQEEFNSGIWPIDVDHINKNRNLSETLIADNIICSGLHRKCFSQFDEVNLSAITELWYRLGLVEIDEGNSIVREMLLLNPSNR